MTTAAIYPPAIGTDERRASLSAWLALAVLVATTLFAFVDRQIITLVAQPLQLSLGLTDLQLGALQGLGLAIFAGFASYPASWLADRYGRRLILCIGIAVWAVSTAVCSFQTSFTGLFLSTIGIAVGEAGLAPIIWSIIPDIFPQRQRMFANFVYFAASLVGAAIGMVLGGAALGWLSENPGSLPAFLQSFEPWRAALLVVALPGPLFLILVALIRIEAPASRLSGTGPAAGHRARFLPYARENMATLATIFGAIGAYNVGMVSTIMWIPVAIPRLFHVTPATIGMQLGGALAVGSIAGLVTAGLMVKCWRGNPALIPFRVAQLLLGIAIVPTTLLGFVTAPWQALLVVAIQLAVGTGAASLMPGILQEIGPAALRARIIAFLSIVGALAQGLSPLLVGALSPLIEGPRGLLIAIVVVGTPGWLVAALLLRRAEEPFMITLDRLKANDAR